MWEGHDAYAGAARKPVTPSTLEVYPLDQILDTAKSLFGGGDQGPTEYARGVCELIGRLRLDCFGVGDGTGENALTIAARLG